MANAHATDMIEIGSGLFGEEFSNVGCLERGAVQVQRLMGNLPAWFTKTNDQCKSVKYFFIGC